MIKKQISILLTVAMVVAAVSGCGREKTNSSAEEQNREDAQDTEGMTDIFEPESEESELKVVTTIFPEYDWVKEIAGEETEHIDLTMLLDNGVDLHSYQPTAEDMMKISDCDLFIYVGGESDGWVDDALKEAVNQNMKVINLLDVLGNEVKEEEIVEGMETEEEAEGETEEEEPEFDEHVCLSVKNAKVFCQAIAEALEEIDPANSDVYVENVADYVEKLDSLDVNYQNTVEQATKKTLVFGDRFPFRYLVDDYGLNYYAAFVGCSAETEASFETIRFLAEKVDELGLKNVMTIEKSDQKIAKTIIENTKTKDQNILKLDSMQSTTSEEVINGATYLSIMEANLDVLREALQ